jgi:hypothetical protein
VADRANAGWSEEPNSRGNNGFAADDAVLAGVTDRRGRRQPPRG